MEIYMMLFILCVCVSGSGYLGYLSGIHSKRNHSYRNGYGRGYQDGYNQAGIDVPRTTGERALWKLRLNSLYGKTPYDGTD